MFLSLLYSLLLSQIHAIAAPSMRVGSYVLAVKERMMGIYLAVYVHRDVEPLLQGEYPPHSPGS